MAFATLRFPEDIKWQRLCVAESMIDRKVCDRTRPPRWRSSAAVFTFEPPEEEQPLPDETVMYVKVVATITGFQPDGEEINVPDSDWETLPGIEDFENVLNEYYPCFGALLEVVVGPPPERVAPGQEGEIPANQYPYIAAVEPKKRELYELVSETGEQSSRSVQGVNVKQGTTSTDSTEAMDIFGGGNITIPTGEKSSVGLGFQGQWGTRSLSSTEHQDVRTTDALEEMRNTFSRTTSLTQMYSLLQTYHLGTNRAVFLLQPRPHVVQSEFTFVNGPRQLEGVQEVFLVVARPKDQERPCILVDLETAHLAFRPEFTAETRTVPHELHILAKAEDRGGSIGDDSVTVEVEDSSTYIPPLDCEIISYEFASVTGERIEEYHVDFGPTFLTIFGKVTWRFEDKVFGNQLLDGKLDIVVRITLQKKTPTQTGEVETLFLTGRRLCCCEVGLQPELLRLPDFVVGEQSMARYSLRFPKGPATKEALLETRRAITILGQEMRELSTSPSRYPLGQVHFYDTDIFQRRLAAHLRAHGTQAQIPIEGKVPDELRTRFGPKRKQPFTIADFLSIPAAMVARSLGQAVTKVRRERLLNVVRALKGSGKKPYGD